MAFIDDLSLVLDLLILVTAAVFYTSVLVWFEVRRKDTVRANTHLREGATILGLLGGFLALFGIWGEMFWPLPGAYNLFFFDVVVMLSLLLVAFALAVHQKFPTHFVGMLGVVIGLGVLFYGVRAYQLNLTKDPWTTLLLYLGFGTVAILSYPATLFVDWFVVGPASPGSDPLPSPPIPNYPWIWRILLSAFLLVVFLAGLAAVGYGIETTWGHLASPP
jgi:putative membrane protein